MQNTTPVIDRADVERIAYQAIGHQFRLPSLFSMLLLVVGFVLGHYVAARHTGELADRLEARITALHEKVAALEVGGPIRSGTLAMTSTSDVASGESETSPFDEPVSQSPPTFRLTGLGRTLEGAPADFTVLSSAALGQLEQATSGAATREAIEGIRKSAGTDRDACLSELAPYVDRKLSIPASSVVLVVEKIYADLDHQLESAGEQAAAKANGIEPRDTSVKIFPPMSEESGAAPTPPTTALGGEGYRYFPKPAAPRSLFFSPVGNRRPAPQTSAIDTESIIR